MKVPAGLERVKGLDSNFHRSQEWKPVTLRMDLSVESGDAMVKVSMEVENQAENHRLRMLLPTGIPGGKYFANEPFCVLERVCGQKEETRNWRECDPLEKAMTSFAGKRDQEGYGLGFAAAYGLHEVAGLPDEAGTLAVTLLRSFGQCAPAQQCFDGQMLGKFVYRFGLIPLTPEVSYGALQRKQDCLAAGTESQVDLVAAEPCPESHSFFSLEGDQNLCYSTLKLPEAGEGLVVRLFNLSDTNAAGRLVFDRPVKEAALLDLKEEPMEILKARGEKVELSVAPWKIATVPGEFVGSLRQ